jgi:hypothetical protein
LTSSRRTDYRDRRDRLEIHNANWDVQMERLVDAYLDCIMCTNSEGLLSSPPLAAEFQGVPLPPIDLIDTYCKFHFLFCKSLLIILSSTADFTHYAID